MISRRGFLGSAALIGGGVSISHAQSWIPPFGAQQQLEVESQVWQLPFSLWDLDFANGRYFGGTSNGLLSSLLSITRTTTGTDLLPTSPSGQSFTTFASGAFRITPGKGLLVEGARTNVLLNSGAPATQTTASLGTGTYTLWVNGSGSAASSAGTATITGAGTATQGTPNVFAVTIAGTVTITVSGSLNQFQCELGAFGSSYIPTTGATVTRNADNITASAMTLAIVTNSGIGKGAFFGDFKSQPGAALGGVVSLSDGSTNNRIDMISNSVGLCRYIVTVGSSSKVNANQGGSVTANKHVKAIIQWGASEGLFYVNGTTGSTSVAISPSGNNQIQIGNIDGSSTNQLYNYIKRLAYSPQAFPTYLAGNTA